MINLLFLRKIFFISLLLIAATLPLFSIQTNSVFIIISFIIALIHFLFFEQKKIWNDPFFLLFVGLYFMHYLGFINTTNTGLIFFDIEQKLSFLALPLIFKLGPSVTTKQKKIIMIVFVGVVLAVCLLSFKNGFHWGYSNYKLYDSLLIHHPYLGLYCVFCIFFYDYIISSEKNIKWKLSNLIIFIFFIFFIFILFAKMAIIVSFVLIFFYFIYYLNKKKKNTLIAGSIILVVITIGYFTLVNSTGKEISKQIISLQTLSGDKYNSKVINSLNLRFLYWSCASYILSEDKKWFFGVGTEKAQQALDNCYIQRNFHSILIKEHHDTHNQYFITWLSLGLIPLLFFVFHFLILLYKYLMDKNIIALIFTFGIMLFCITESIMENQKGIVFYTFFQSLFLFKDHYQKIKPKKILNY